MVEDFYKFYDIQQIPKERSQVNSDFKYFTTRLFVITPRNKPAERDFLDFPRNLSYELYSRDSIRIPLHINFNDDAQKNKEFSPSKIVLAVPDAQSNNDFYQKEFKPDSLPAQIIIPRISEDSFNLKVYAYYDYHDDGIYGKYREKHEITIPCELTQSAKLMWLWPVQGALLGLHDTLGFLQGQIAIAQFWNTVIILAFLFWLVIVLLPFIIPPDPKVKFAVKRE
jgi:hypothetical protein